MASSQQVIDEQLEIAGLPQTNWGPTTYYLSDGPELKGNYGTYRDLMYSIAGRRGVSRNAASVVTVGVKQADNLPRKGTVTMNFAGTQVTVRW